MAKIFRGMKKYAALRLVWGALIAADIAVAAMFAIMLHNAVRAQPAPPVSTRAIAPSPAATAQDFAAQPAIDAQIDAQPPRQSDTPESSFAEVYASTQTEIQQTAQQPQAEPPPAKNAAKPRQKTAFRVKIYYYNSQARSVAALGTFSSWKPAALKRRDGRWEAELFLREGSYLYLLKVDGEKMPDPLQPLRREGKSVLVVKKP